MPIRNTLGVQAEALAGCIAHGVDDVKQAVAYAADHGLTFRLLGEGSNIIPSREVNQFICHQAMKGIHTRRVDAAHELVTVAAGENWHGFVMRMLQAGLYGLENLALIPGSVGAAPVQNIGAYGVEVAQFLQSVQVMEPTGEVRDMDAGECGFGYRSSVFQTQAQLSILTVTFKLGKQPAINRTYLEVDQALHDVDSPSPHALADAVIQIRRRKLPDPATDPNVGSFFKNPLIAVEDAERLRLREPDLSVFHQAGRAKLSAAQLIDRCGWKDRGTSALYCWPTQPLVIVNPGHLAATEVLKFAEDIRDDVVSQYDVQLELEPSVLS
jgi:UDP-N-acetylmuramate dehydrogenase